MDLQVVILSGFWVLSFGIDDDLIALYFGLFLKKETLV